MKKCFFPFIVCLIFFTKSATAQLVLSGAFVNITNGAYLVVENSSTSAITRNSGHIISEGQNNNVLWRTGTATGTYTVPLGYSTSNYIPVTFTKSAGTGSGYFVFATYHTGWQNSASLPSGVLNVDRDHMDQSPYIVDRFWKIDAAGYTVKPNLTNLTLTYIDAEQTAGGNSIIENEIGLQRWNSTINDWGDFIPAVTINTTNNTVSVSSVTSANLYKWWVMPSSSPAHTLPVELVSFTASCDGDQKTFNWSTASEHNSASFTLESSADGISWRFVKILAAAGNSNRMLNYSVNDDNSNTDIYYRLKQMDYDGRKQYSDMIRINCENNSPLAALSVYPNPTTGTLHIRNATMGSSLNVINVTGEVVYSQNIGNAEEETLNLDGYSKGVYIVSIRNGQMVSNNKIVLQ